MTNKNTDELEARIKELEAKINKLEGVRVALNGRIELLDRKCDDWQDDYIKLQKELDAKEARIKELEKNLTYAQEVVSSLPYIVDLKSQLADRDATIKKLNMALLSGISEPRVQVLKDKVLNKDATIDELCEALHHCSAAAGNPSHSDACRNIISIAKAALKKGRKL